METASKTLLPPHQQIANFQYSYPETGPKPCALFWSQLIRSKRSPRMLIPDTLIINAKNQPLTWLYSNSQNMLSSTTNISIKDYISKITSFCSPNQLVGVVKRLVTKSQLNNFGNDIKLVNARYLHNLSLQQFGDQVIVIQKYVKSHGKNAFICRTVFRNGTHHFCFLITNRKGYFDEDVPENQRFLVTNGMSMRTNNKFTITKTSTGKHLAQTLPVLQQIVDHMRFQRGIYLTQLVGDFIKDQQGNWWLTDIKAFKYDQKPRASLTSPTHLLMLGEKEKYQRTKQCRYCEIPYLQSQLTHKLTRQMLIEMDRYLLHLGRNFQWLSRCDIPTDTHSLYQQQIVCTRCYRLYTQMQALLSFQAKFLAKLNLNSQGNPKQLLTRLTSKQQLQAQAKGKQILNLKTTIPQQISIGPNSSIITKDNKPIRNDQAIHEMYRYRFLLYLHQLDQLVGVTPGTNYHLQFTIFNTKFKIKLDLRPNMKSTLIKKLRVCYFFFPTQNQIDSLQEYIQKYQSLVINLVAQNRVTGQKKTTGCLTLSLKEFLTPGRKNFYKFFDTQYGFGWGLQGSIGIIKTEKEVNTSRLILTTQDRIVYLPSQNYFICQPLPQDWIVELQNKSNKCRQKALENTIKTIQCYPKTPLDSGEQFIPQQTFLSKSVKKTQIDWKAQLNKQLKKYQRSAFKQIKKNK